MKSRRQFLTTLGAGACAVSLGAFAQQPGGLRRIGFLAPLHVQSGSHIAALRAGMIGLGYVEGKTFSIVFRGQDRGIERLGDLAAALVRSGVHLIVASGAPQVMAAKQATSSIPIVMVATPDAVAMRLVADLQRPGGNVTGSTYSSPQTMQRRLEWLKQAYIRAHRVAVLVNPASPVTASTLLSLGARARDLKIEILPLEVPTRQTLNKAFGDMARANANAFLIADDALAAQYATPIVELAISRRLPGIGPQAYADAGGLMSYDVHLATAWNRAPDFVSRIFKGARPADMPLSAATRFELVLNRKGARSVGIAFPQPLLARADRVIEGGQDPCVNC